MSRVQENGEEADAERTKRRKFELEGEDSSQVSSLPQQK